MQCLVDDSGRERLVLGRDVEGKRVTIAERESEEFDVSSQSYIDGLVSISMRSAYVGWAPALSISFGERILFLLL